MKWFRHIYGLASPAALHQRSSWWWVCLAALALLFTIGCDDVSGARIVQTRHRVPGLDVESVYGVNVEFDRSDRCVCVRWLGATEEVGYAIFGLDGRLLSSHTSSNAVEFVPKFPYLAVSYYYSNIVAGAERFVVSGDLSRLAVVRAVKDAPTKLEMWRLDVQTPHIMWTRVSTNLMWRELILPVGWRPLGAKEAFVLDLGAKCLFLEADTGQPLQTVGYGPHYSSASVDVVPERRWLVCGSSNGKHMRIINLDSPHQVIRDEGTLKRAAFGYWACDRIQAAMDGKRLLREYRYGSALFGSTLIVEVVDTETWKILWKDVHHLISACALSQDGRYVAHLRGNELVIVPLGEAK
jgi:hypothetical protein